MPTVDTGAPRAPQPQDEGEPWPRGHEPSHVVDLEWGDVYYVPGIDVYHRVAALATNGARVCVVHGDGTFAHYGTAAPVVIVWDTSCDGVRPATDAEFVGL